MAYKEDNTWADLSRIAQNRSRQLLEVIRSAEADHKEWLNLKGSATNAQLAIKVGRTEADIDALENCFKAMNELYKFMINDPGAVAGNHAETLRDFS